MIELLSGHFGCGHWRFKVINEITILTHFQPFHSASEFRIGPDQVQSYEVIEQDTDKVTVDIYFSQDRQCRAKMPSAALSQLDNMVHSHAQPPEAHVDNQRWIQGILVMLVVLVMYALFK